MTDPKWQKMCCAAGRTTDLTLILTTDERGWTRISNQGGTQRKREGKTKWQKDEKMDRKQRATTELTADITQINADEGGSNLRSSVFIGGRSVASGEKKNRNRRKALRIAGLRIWQKNDGQSFNQSQRDCDASPGLARNELTLGNGRAGFTTPAGLRICGPVTSHRTRRDTNRHRLTRIRTKQIGRKMGGRKMEQPPVGAVPRPKPQKHWFFCHVEPSQMPSLGVPRRPRPSSPPGHRPRHG